MSRYLFCLPRYHTNLVQWVRILQENGHYVSIHVSTTGKTENYNQVTPKRFDASFLSRCISEIAPSSTPKLRHTPGFLSYFRVMKHEAPDVVIVRGVTYWFSRTAALSAILQRRKLVIYDQEDAEPRAWSTWLRRALFRSVGIPHYTARLPRDGTRQTSGGAIPLPFGGTSHKNKIDTKSHYGRSVRLLMVAKYRTRKAHHNLIHALSRIQNPPMFTLTFCAEMASNDDQLYKEGLISAASNLGLIDKIRFIENIPHDQMPDVYREHDVFILPSQNEPAAVSPIEAAWNGCAVLISRDSGTRNYMPDGEDFEFSSDNIDEMARVVGLAIQNPVHLESLRSRCRGKVEAIGSDAIILEKFRSMLRQY
jgi:glycosyltransferase involved in cell wall biosynthesis